MATGSATFLFSLSFFICISLLFCKNPVILEPNYFFFAPLQKDNYGFA